MPEYPSNSHNRREKEKKKHYDKMVNGEVEVRKKPLGRKFAETMFNTDARYVKDHVIQDIIIPSIQEFIFNGLHDFIDTVFKSGDSSRSYSRSSGGSRTSYEKYYYKSGSGSSSNSKPTFDQPLRNPNDAYEYLFDDRGEADRTLEEMRSIIDEFGKVTLNDYYEMIGQTSKLGSATDADFGWTNLNGVTISTVRGSNRERKYVINLPRLEQLT